MITAFRSELLLLNRFRVWAIAGLVTIAFTITATTLMITTAQPGSEVAGVPGSGEGMTIEQMSGPGGATAAVSWAIYGFGFILLLTAFTSRIGSEFTNGTFRTALLHHPNRWSLIGGKMLAMMAVTIALIIVGLATGAGTAAVVAPGQGIDTAGWFGAEGIREAAIDFARISAWAFGWALIGTTLAVLVRSVPLAIGIGVFWFGPIENVIGENQDIALRWFPGLLLQQAASGSQAVASLGTVSTTLAAYGLVMIAITAIFFKRLDVTA